MILIMLIGNVRGMFFLNSVNKIHDSNKHKTSLQTIELEGIEDSLDEKGYKCFF